MINSKIFFKGLFSIKRLDSPGIALGASFVAIGALLKNIGFTIEESIFSSFLIYALPGSLVLAESTIIGASLLNIFLAVWLVNSRLYPMTVSLMPLVMANNQPKWKYYLSCHFVAVSSWLILKSNYKKIDKKYRIDFWIGIGTATWLIGIFSTIIGYLSADYLNKDMMMGLAIVNPIYFMCAMIGVMKSKSISVAVILGTVLGPIFYIISPEWCILFGGFIACTIAYLIGEKNVI
jgi:predicted branched-subunit amino acid permease